MSAEGLILHLFSIWIAASAIYVIVNLCLVERHVFRASRVKVSDKKKPLRAVEVFNPHFTRSSSALRVDAANSTVTANLRRQKR